MNPHRLTWGFAYNMPFAEIVAIALLLGIMFSKESKRIPMDSMLVVGLAFVLWMGVTTIFALHQSFAIEYYISTLKILLLTYITMILMSDQRKINLLLLVISLSIGYYSIKGGVFTLITGGAYRVYGPPNSFIGENNALALATLMIVPLMFYLRAIATRNSTRLAWLLAMLLSGVSILGSQSRGAFLGILAITGYFWKDTRGKIISGFLVAVLAYFAFLFMPVSWHERMESIKHYQEDPSAMSRIAAWKYSIGVANSRITGGGFQSYSKENYEKYSSQVVERAFVAHSIYFSVLGSHGWPGLLMFFSIIGISWRNLSSVRRVAQDKPELHAQYILSQMLKISLIAYLTGGAFLSLAYFDLPWHIFAITYLLKQQVLKKAPSIAPIKPRNLFLKSGD
jgi:probable O-glycosylation ligase (exosortase A-associated)